MKKMCIKKLCQSVSRGWGFVNMTVPEGGPTATGMNLEGGTAKKSCRPPPPHRF